MSETLEAGGYSFRPVAPPDLVLLRHWLGQPHVAEWWGDPDHEIDLIREGLDMAWVRSFIVSTASGPFAYVQTWEVFGDPEGCPFPDQPHGTLGIDPFIGPADLVGKGLGSGFLRHFVGLGFQRGVPRFVIDPDPANGRAVAAYTKAGFVVQGERETSEGRICFMVCDRGPARTTS